MSNLEILKVSQGSKWLVSILLEKYNSSSKSRVLEENWLGFLGDMSVIYCCATDYLKHSSLNQIISEIFLKFFGLARQFCLTWCWLGSLIWLDVQVASQLTWVTLLAGSQPGFFPLPWVIPYYSVV